MALPTPSRSIAPSSAAASSFRLISSTRFPPPSQPNTSSVSLLSSTAQGQPIPLSDANTASITALRELSRSQPIARHPYNQVSGPPPSTTSTTTGTYSQPVLVRTYSGPISSSARPRSATRRDDVSSVRSGPGTRLSSPGDRRPRPRGPLFAISIVRPQVTKKLSPRDDFKLPPLKAFTFKSIMAEIEQDISADLDRIADICARSRYSLSNQYEIHVAPYGSGDSFIQTSPALVSAGASRHDGEGPTLQAISIDEASISHGARATGRHRSAAYGTLETIMSSSRSSEEDGSGKLSAAEIAAQVRGRTQRSNLEDSGDSSAPSIEAQASSDPYDKQTKKLPRTRSTLAAAILDHSRAYHHFDPPLRRSRWSSDTVLVGDPAVPKTSHSHLMSGTTPESVVRESGNTWPFAKEQTTVSVSKSVATAATAISGEPRAPPGLLSGCRFNIPGLGTSATDTHPTGQETGKATSYAEGALRQLLKATPPSWCSGVVKSTGGASGRTG
ncbi:hypothetical protein GGR50DRAFT_581360 [Xylaria sp. CBS 124048]|nr:hypothetical protein GGR50DRAFT_581360 [Xylaria sp. CBS 124048]